MGDRGVSNVHQTLKSGSLSGLASSDDRSSTPCRFYQRGHCWRGANCWYKHDPMTVEVSPPSTSRLVADPSSPSPALMPSSRCSGNHSPLNVKAAAFQPAAPTNNDMLLPTEAAAEEQICMICFEVPSKFGLLENCAHVFCLKCIRDWRREKNKTPEQIEGGVLRRCPACRVVSNNVIPSDFCYATGTIKESFIQLHKERLANIPCKHFAQSQAAEPEAAYCPFGRDCFYQHLDSNGQHHIFTHGMADHIQDLRQMRNQARLERDLRRMYDNYRGVLVEMEEGSEHAYSDGYDYEYDGDDLSGSDDDAWSVENSDEDRERRYGPPGRQSMPPQQQRRGRHTPFLTYQPNPAARPDGHAGSLAEYSASEDDDSEIERILEADTAEALRRSVLPDNGASPQSEREFDQSRQATSGGPLTTAAVPRVGLSVVPDWWPTVDDDRGQYDSDGQPALSDTRQPSRRRHRPRFGADATTTREMIMDMMPSTARTQAARPEPSARRLPWPPSVVNNTASTSSSRRVSPAPLSPARMTAESRSHISPNLLARYDDAMSEMLRVPQQPQLPGNWAQAMQAHHNLHIEAPTTSNLTRPRQESISPVATLHPLLRTSANAPRPPPTGTYGSPVRETPTYSTAQLVRERTDLFYDSEVSNSDGE